MIKVMLLLIVALLMSGCVDAINKYAVPNLDAVLQSQGISPQLSRSITKVGSSVVKSMEDVTPEQEYYIGRSVSANILSRYRVYNDKVAQAYINKIGLLLTYQSDLPSTYGGYHFLILDSDEINAFAAPGGFIFVTRGILRCANSEDAIAAILAHEICHVTNRHGMRSIKSSRWSSVGTLLAAESAKNYTNANIATLVTSFEGSINDVVNSMIVNGYSRSYELEADQSAYKILERLGYNPSALIDMLRIMDKRLQPGAKDFASTHPSPADRKGAFADTGVASVEIPKERIGRFQRNLAKI